MELPPFPAQSSTAARTVACTVAFASVDTLSWALQGVRLDNTWITARADVVRVFHPRPMLEIGDAGAINGRNQEPS